MKNHKLIIFAYDFPPYDGGIARLCHEIAVGMHSLYSEVLVFSKAKEGVSIPYNSNKINITLFPARRGAFEIAAVKHFKQIKHKENYDVLCGQWHPEAILLFLGGFKQVCILAHGTEFLSGTSRFRKYFWLKTYCSFILKKSKLIIANSNYTAGLVKSVCQTANVKALPLAVNPDFFKPKDKLFESEVLKICTVSRIEKFKGHDFIAEVIASLPKHKRERIRWNIAGRGPDLAYVKQKVADLSLTSIVSFKGFVSDNTLPEFYNENDLFILCSRQSDYTTTVEGFGLVFLEAQSCGVPVIGTKTGGIPDAIKEGEGGWLINQDNHNELKEILLQILADNTLLKDQSEKARQRVIKEATWDLYNKQLKELIDVDQ